MLDRSSIQFFYMGFISSFFYVQCPAGDGNRRQHSADPQCTDPLVVGWHPYHLLSFMAFASLLASVEMQDRRPSSATSCGVSQSAQAFITPGQMT